MKSKLVGLLGLFVLLSIMALPPIFADQISEDISYSNLKLVQNVIPMNISSENTLPWAAVKGTIENHATGYPVIIQIYQNNDPVHFAQTDINDDGSYEYKFRIKSVDGDRVINVFEGDYEVKISKTIKINSEF